MKNKETVTITTKKEQFEVLGSFSSILNAINSNGDFIGLIEIVPAQGNKLIAIRKDDIITFE